MLFRSTEKPKLKDLWSGKYLARTIMLWIVWFGIVYSYYGIFTWLPAIVYQIICRLEFWDHSSAGRASALQAEGHRFEPYWSHLFAGVAELADAQDLKSCGTYTPVPVRPRSPAFITTAVVVIMEYSIRTCSSAG